MSVCAYDWLTAIRQYCLMSISLEPDRRKLKEAEQQLVEVTKFTIKTYIYIYLYFHVLSFNVIICWNTIFYILLLYLYSLFSYSHFVHISYLFDYIQCSFLTLPFFLTLLLFLLYSLYEQAQKLLGRNRVLADVCKDKLHEQIKQYKQSQFKLKNIEKDMQVKILLLNIAFRNMFHTHMLNLSSL